MSSLSTVDGLISGLNTSDIIDKLVQIESAPQQVLARRQSKATSDATYYRNVNTRFDSLRSAAEALTTAAAFTATRTTSSSSTVAVSATAGAAGGSLTFNVDAIAARHTVLSDTVWTSTADAFAVGTSLSLPNADGTAGSVATTGTLAEVVSAVNAGAFGVTASAVQVGVGQYRLQLTAKDSGAAETFTAGAGTEAFSQVVETGADAKITVGSGPGKFSVTSPTNTITGLMDGVTLTVSQATPVTATSTGTPVTVGVSSDPAAVAGKMKALVDAANFALKGISEYTDPKNAQSLLKNDRTLRALSTRILDAVSSAIGGTASASQVGVSLTRTGTLAFDSAAFTTALGKDPALVQRIVSGVAGVEAVPAVVDGNGVETSPAVAGVAAVEGLASRLAAIGKAVSDPTIGSLTLLAQTKDSTAKDFQSQIDAWQVRLDLKRASLGTYYKNLETALGTLKSQSTWLSGQLASLPTWSQ